MTILRYLWIIFCLGLSWIVPAAIEQIDRRRKERPRSESRSRHRRRPQPFLSRPVTQYPQESLLWASHFSPPQASTDFSSRCQYLRAAMTAPAETCNCCNCQAWQVWPAGSYHPWSSQLVTDSVRLVRH